MAQVRAYLMSFVGLQLSVARDHFAERFPHAWLVWEPGTWHVPQASSHRTQVPGLNRPSTPGKGDALCFELAVEPGARLHVGRMEAHAVAINDATFSRDQLVVTRSPADGWMVEMVPGATPCTLDGHPLGTVPRPLSSGAKLAAGAVTLRFYQPFDFVARLVQEIARGWG